MERKEFIKSFTCGCGLMGLAGLTVLGKPSTDEISAMAETKPEDGTPCADKYAFAQTYVKRLMDIFNDKLDEKTRVDLVQTMGAACAKGAYGEITSNTSKWSVDDFLTKLGRRKEGSTIYWQYHSNPAGLKVADGYCLCPVTEKGPEGLSGLWCECSIGYVRYMFELATGQKVDVELLESLKKGGSGCRFKITLI
jgi:hypothetical protein